MFARNKLTWRAWYEFLFKIKTNIALWGRAPPQGPKCLVLLHFGGVPPNVLALWGGTPPLSPFRDFIMFLKRSIPYIPLMPSTFDGLQSNNLFRASP